MMQELKEPLKSPIKSDPSNITPVRDDLGSRDSARNFIEYHLLRKHQEIIKDLHVLLDMLPSKLTPEQDTALWNILNNSKL